MLDMTRLPTRSWRDLTRAAYLKSDVGDTTERFVDTFSEAEIMAAADTAVLEYVNDPALCSDDEGEFPSRSLLTGCFYVDRLADHGVSGGRRRILVSCACLGREVNGEEVPYLGLDVRISAPVDVGPLRVDRVDSYVL